MREKQKVLCWEKDLAHSSSREERNCVFVSFDVHPWIRVTFSSGQKSQNGLPLHDSANHFIRHSFCQYLQDFGISCTQEFQLIPVWSDPKYITNVVPGSFSHFGNTWGEWTNTGVRSGMTFLTSGNARLRKAKGLVLRERAGTFLLQRYVLWRARIQVTFFQQESKCIRNWTSENAYALVHVRTKDAFVSVLKLCLGKCHWCVQTYPAILRLSPEMIKGHVTEYNKVLGTEWRISQRGYARRGGKICKDISSRRNKCFATDKASRIDRC